MANCQQPLIGITPDVSEQRWRVAPAYAAQVRAAGGIPVILPPLPEAADDYLQLIQGLVLTGGDDPIMEDFGVTTHPKATPIDRRRQTFELALLNGLQGNRELPLLGICLGMQLMTLHAGGQLDQYLPESLETAEQHMNGAVHEVTGSLGHGMVHSHHRQAMRSAGSLAVVAHAPDGVIEAVACDERPFYLGVQWHPERTESDVLGQHLFDALVNAARKETSAAT